MHRFCLIGNSVLDVSVESHKIVIFAVRQSTLSECLYVCFLDISEVYLAS